MSLSPEKESVNPQETSLTVSPVRDTKREEIEEQEAPLFPEQEIVKRHLNFESLCSFDRLGDHLEADLNRDIVKHFEMHEKEKLSKKSTKYEIIITGFKGSRVLWPKSKEVCSHDNSHYFPFIYLCWPIVCPNNKPMLYAGFFQT